jgi:hypothetical protein
MERMDNARTLASYHVPPVGAARGAWWEGRVGARQARARTALHAAYAPAARPPTRHPASPQGCKVMLALEKAKLESGRPDPDSPYWN